MKKRLLIVEDEEQIARVLKIELEYEGYDVELAYDGKSGLDAILTYAPDLVLLDIMLPGLSGIEVLRRVRKTESLLPVILLTARDATYDKIMGLDLGANDYITKPFEIEEVLARIRSCLRFTKAFADEGVGETQKLTLGPLTVDLETREAVRDSTSISLTPKEYDLLIYLLENQNKIVTRETIISTVWGYDFEGETNVVDVYIRHLRRKIDDEFAFPLIHTVRGVGYTMKVK
ncbi:response regulator transcription factor [Peribacillus kribbensis]|uniref:response regulator transcription factor n=1 Tax=Peribacillus kribbensis TaxID=356658 RepID=UPI000478AAE6|nr:response regulator transcription factor [Peribacillus kribbensis]